MSKSYLITTASRNFYRYEVLVVGRRERPQVVAASLEEARKIAKQKWGIIRHVRCISPKANALWRAPQPEATMKPPSEEMSKTVSSELPYPDRRCPACDNHEATITPPPTSILPIVWPVHRPSGMVCVKWMQPEIYDALKKAGKA